MYCTSCGAENADDAKFCIKCGVHISPSQQFTPLDGKQTSIQGPDHDAPYSQEKPAGAGGQSDIVEWADEPTRVREGVGGAQDTRSVRPITGRPDNSNQQRRPPYALIATIAIAGVTIAGLVAFILLRPQSNAAPTNSTDTSSAIVDAELADAELRHASITISEADVSEYPLVTLYVSVQDEKGASVSGLDSSSWKVREIGNAGDEHTGAVSDFQPISQGSLTYRLSYASSAGAKPGDFTTARASLDTPDGLSGFAERTYSLPKEEEEKEPSTTTINVQPVVPQAPTVVTPTSRSEYILPESNIRYYSRSELRGLSKWELNLARNEIYARHGRGFNDNELQNYFNSCSWYRALYSPSEFDAMPNVLNDYERKNVDLILEEEGAR